MVLSRLVKLMSVPEQVLHPQLVLQQLDSPHLY